MNTNQHIPNSQYDVLCKQCEHQFVCMYQPEFETFMKSAVYLNGMATPDFIEFQMTCRWYKKESPTMRTNDKSCLI